MSNTNKFYDPFLALKNKNQMKRASENAMPRKFFLIRNDTRERVMINKSMYKIGKQSGTCDYVVRDNKYIGRHHASILIENGNAFLVDNNSTNKSYVNGNQVMPNEKVLLKSGDEIKLANLIFNYAVE